MKWLKLMTDDDITKYAPRVQARATFLECSLGKAVETCFPDPAFCQSKQESDEAAEERSDRTLRRPRLAQPAASTAIELRQLTPDMEVILPKTHFFKEQRRFAGTGSS